MTPKPTLYKRKGHQSITAHLPDKDVLLEKYQSGKTFDQLADEYKVSASTIRNRLKATGKYKPPSKNLPDNDVLLQMYENGASLGRLGKRYKVSAETIRNKLIETGKYKPRIWKKRQFTSQTAHLPDKDDLLEMYQSGMTAPELATKYRVCAATIRNRLKMTGKYQPRKGGKPGRHSHKTAHLPDNETLLELYNDGKSHRQLADEYNVSAWIIQKRVKATGKYVPRKRRKKAG